MNLSDAETDFSEKNNQLKAIGDLLSVADSSNLLKDSVNYIGRLIIDLSEELSKNFEFVLIENFKLKDNFK